jgi:hypothetical protein
MSPTRSRVSQVHDLRWLRSLLARSAAPVDHIPTSRPSISPLSRHSCSSRSKA